MNINYIIAYLLFLPFLLTKVYGQHVWKVDSSRVVFKILNAGFEVEGSIQGINAHITFSPERLNKSFFTASAEAATIQTGIRLRDKHLKKPEYFDVDTYPLISISSKKISKTKDGYESLSTLTIKGISKDVKIPFTVREVNNKTEFSGSFSINRLDFSLGEESLILSETVTINVWICATD